MQFFLLPIFLMHVQTFESGLVESTLGKNSGILVNELFKRPFPGLDEKRDRAFVLHRARFSHDGKMVAAVAKGSVVIWDSEKGEELHRLDFKDERPAIVEFTLDGKYLLVFSSPTPFSGKISKWDLKTKKRVFAVPGFGGNMYCLPGNKEFLARFPPQTKATHAY